MTEELRLVEVSSENFSAVLRPFENCDFMEAMKIINCFYQNDKQGAFDHALKMFFNELSDDKKEDLKTIADQEIVHLVTNWMMTN